MGGEPDTPAARLARLRAETVATIAELESRIDGVVAARADANVDDEHDPEGTTIAFERSQSAALLQAARQRLTEIDGALDRVALDRYGVCTVCGDLIPPERLAARPFASRCLRHS